MILITSVVFFDIGGCAEEKYQITWRKFILIHWKQLILYNWDFLILIHRNCVMKYVDNGTSQIKISIDWSKYVGCAKKVMSWKNKVDGSLLTFLYQ